MNNQGKLFAALYCEARALRAAAVSDELALHPGMLASGQTSGRQQAAGSHSRAHGAWIPGLHCGCCSTGLAPMDKMCFLLRLHPHPQKVLAPLFSPWVDAAELFLWLDLGGKGEALVSVDFPPSRVAMVNHFSVW